jgi:transposase
MEKEARSTAAPEPEYAAFVAIDWADQQHYWQWSSADGQNIRKGVLDNTPEAVEVWVQALQQQFGNRPLALAVEQRRGAVVAMLSKYEGLYLYPVHPKTLARYREAWHPSGSKSDRGDAALLWDLLVRHREQLRRLEPDTSDLRLLQTLVEDRRKLVDERTALTNRLTDRLKISFPQMVRWFDDLGTVIVGDLLAKWPSLVALQKATTTQLQKFLRQHGRSSESSELLIDQIRQAVPATTDQAILGPAQLMIQVWLSQIAILRENIKEFDQQIARIAETQPDWAIVSSFPGAGPVLAPRIMAALGTKRERFLQSDELLCLTGIAPVTAASGNSSRVHIRWACSNFLRQTFHEWAKCSLSKCAWAKAYYDSLTARGKKHHTAVRALAFKWIRILFRCWHDGQPYQEDLYLASLAKRSRPMAKSL